MPGQAGSAGRGGAPWVGGLEATPALLRDPYRFIGQACRAHRTPVVEARLLLQRTLCLVGPKAAQLFYDPERFERRGAAPRFLQATLFGEGGVQGLDGPLHRHRKALFMLVTSPEQVQAMLEHSARAWYWALDGLAGAGEPRALYGVVREVLTQAVHAWTGVPLAAADRAARTEELTALFDAASAGPAAHLRARAARRRLEHALCTFICEVRAGEHTLAPGSAAQAVAWWRDGQGRLLPPRIAAVELLNVLRPVVAASVFIVQAAHALHAHPESAERLKAEVDEGRYLRAFVQEVRRHYPFFPAVAARVRHTFEWEGVRFPAGRRVLLDLYGTNHDPEAWVDPDVFRPERFVALTPGAYSFVPQGGAHAATHHRCPGEGLTVALMEQAVRTLVHDLSYTLAPQDLTLDMRRLPALPRQGLLISDCRLNLATRPDVRRQKG